MKYDKRLGRLEDYYCRKLIACHFGTFHPTTYDPVEPINPVDRIMEELEREHRGVFPDALELLTPEERKKYKVQQVLTYKAFDILHKVTKTLTKYYKPRVHKQTN